MLNKKNLFSCNVPINRMLEMSVDEPVHLYCKDRNSVLWGLNEHGLKYFHCSSIKDLISKNDFEYLSYPCAKATIHNDQITLHHKQPMIFIENGHNNDTVFLSIKAAIKTSTNQLSGTFGLAFDLFKVKPYKIINILSKIALPCTHLIPSVLPSIISCHRAITKQEKKCLIHLIRGDSRLDTSRILNISPKTLDTYLMRVKDKLHCLTKKDILSKIMEEGLL